MQTQILVLLSSLFFLLSRAWAGEIIGGHEAKPHSRPYMAYLEIQRGEKTFHCGGFLVAKNFVLTAAHCQGEEITVILGAHDVSEEEDSQQVIPVRRQIPHPKYNKKTLKNDIMLLQLAEEVEVNQSVDSIALPCAKEKVEPGTPCSIAGWGQTSRAGDSKAATKLQEADVVVLKESKCPGNRFWPFREYFPGTMMCAKGPNGNQSAWKGDSGGPLVCRKKAQGIVSWVSADGTPPAVYTRVSTFIPWIQKTMKKLKP